MTIAPEKLRHLIDVNNILASTLELPALLRQVMTLATGVVGAETSSLLLYDADRNELYFDLALNDRESQLKEIRLPLSEGIAGAAARGRASILVNDVAADPRWTGRADERTGFRTRSVLAVPLLFRGRLQGVLEAINRKDGDFTDDDVQLLEAFAVQAAVSIENARFLESIRAEKDKTEAVVTQMSDGLILAGAGGKALMHNAAAVRILGADACAADQAKGVFSGFSVTPPLPELLGCAAPSCAFEMLREAPKKLYLGGTASRINDADGKPAGVIFVFRDVTAERAESMLKRNFLSLISHKLKTPLVTITGYGPMLLSDDSLAEPHRKAVASIHRQGLHLAALVDKLLYFTMVEGDTLDLVRDRADLKRVVGKSVESLRHYLAERGAEVAVDPDLDGLPHLMMDPEKMEGVVRNLIENAVKFSSGDGRRIRVGAARRPGFAGVAVTDTGVGIPPEEREKIFQKFYQIEESFTGQVEGAGLGLALVKRIVEAHGGRVELDSTVGRGTTVTILLPEGN